MKCYLVIVNYNNSKVTIDCIQSVRSVEGSFFKIVIVDNHSDSSNIGDLRTFIQNNVDLNIDLITLSDNIGYFPAINRGITSLNLNGHDDFFLVVGNNDLCFPPEFIQSLHNLHVDKDIFIISPDIITLKGNHQNPHVISRISLLRRLMYRLYFTSYKIACILAYISSVLGANRRDQSRLGYDKEQVIRMGFGACYIILPQFLQKVGLLDESVFLMGEEALLSEQVYSNGGKILYTPSVKVIHQDHSTFKKQPAKSTYNFTKESYKVYKKYL